MTRSESAASSNDSALQWVSIDLLDDGHDADEQRELLLPIEEQIRDAASMAGHDGLRIAARKDPWDGAEEAIDVIKDSIDYSVLPESDADWIREHVERRVDEKYDQLAEMYDDLLHDARRRAEVRAASVMADWGPVV